MKGTPASRVTRLSCSAVSSAWDSDSITHGPAIRASGWLPPTGTDPMWTTLDRMKTEVMAEKITAARSERFLSVETRLADRLPTTAGHG